MTKGWDSQPFSFRLCVKNLSQFTGRQVVLTRAVAPRGQHAAIFLLHWHLAVEVVIAFVELRVEAFSVHKEANVIHQLCFRRNVVAKVVQATNIHIFALILFQHVE